MHRVGGHLGTVKVEHLGDDLEGKACGDAAHALVHPGIVAVLLHGLGLGVGVLEALAVVHLHLAENAGVLRLLQPCQHRELAHHLERTRRARGLAQRRGADQLLVDLDLLAHAQAVRHLDDVDAIEKRLVVLVVAKGLPLALVRVGQHHPVKRDGPEAFRALEVAFLGGGQQGVQHLDRRLEHFHKLQQPLVGQAQATGVAVGIRVILGIGFQLADVDLAHQRRDVLVVLVARLGLGDRHLLEDAGVALDHAELTDVTAELFQAFDRPGAQDPLQVTPGDAVFLLQDRAIFGRIEQPQRRLVHRRALECKEGHMLGQLLEALGNRRLAATHRSQQIQDLLAFLQPLRGMPEVRHHLLDGLFHAVELFEGRVELDDLVGKDARQARIVARVHHLRLANGLQHALGRRGISQLVAFAKFEVFLQGILFLTGALVTSGEVTDHVHADLPTSTHAIDAWKRSDHPPW